MCCGSVCELVKEVVLSRYESLGEGWRNWPWKEVLSFHGVWSALSFEDCVRSGVVEQLVLCSLLLHTENSCMTSLV